jgi:type IX secretion system PorP/SprF family membrane protein
MKRLLLIAILFQLAVQAAVSQQYPLFTNFVTNSFGYNPAFAGLEKGGEARIMYRNQWSGVKLAPQTALGSVHVKLKNFPIGIGGYAFQDQAGRLQRSGGLGVLTLHQKIGPSTSISIGTSFGMSKTAINTEYIAVDPNDIIIAEATKGDSKPEMNIGILLKHNQLYLGFSMPQFMEQKLKFNNIPDALSSSELKRHYYLMGGYRQYIGKMYLEPSMIYKRFKGAPSQVDFSVRVGTGTPLWMGLLYRHDAASSAMIGLDLKNSLNLAYAFDLTTSNLRKASNVSHEITVGYRFMKPKDSDNDGVPDDEDKCPNEPGLPFKGGCPAEKDVSKPDKDKDGVPDLEDDCPTVPGVKENQGCPKEDNDKDGVPNDKDKCPDVFGLKQFEGCPTADRDNDGIRDDLDKCPDNAGPVSLSGCPTNQNDADGDGVPDDDDECPNTPGSKENNGCPTPSMSDMEALNFAIQNLYFDTDKWIIKPTSKPHLDKLGKLMASKRDWKIRISGHADVRGSNEHNLILSKNRAESVMYYLMARGVKREQLIVEYYGETIPVLPGANDEALSQNRRVEMEFIFN